MKPNNIKEHIIFYFMIFLTIMFIILIVYLDIFKPPLIYNRWFNVTFTMLSLLLIVYFTNVIQEAS